jgi:hypothetical protein
MNTFEMARKMIKSRCIRDPKFSAYQIDFIDAIFEEIDAASKGCEITTEKLKAKHERQRVKAEIKNREAKQFKSESQEIAAGILSRIKTFMESELESK